MKSTLWNKVTRERIKNSTGDNIRVFTYSTDQQMYWIVVCGGPGAKVMFDYFFHLN